MLDEPKEYIHIVKVLFLCGLLLLVLLVFVQYALYTKSPVGFCGGTVGVKQCPLSTYCSENPDNNLISGYCTPAMTPAFKWLGL
ncbi:MAG: hypothetical protein ACOZAO_01140 [Patescibacteria group bacterium]